MKIKKYINDAQSKGVASKLLSYSAMAAAFVASGPEAMAQCAGETATPGVPVGLDIDGDGMDDVQLFAGTISTLYSSNSATSQVGTVPLGAYAIPFAATGTFPTLTTTASAYFGCYVAFGALAFNGPATVMAGPATAMATLYVNASVSLVNAFYSTASAVYLTGNYAFVTALASNQIVGLSATGTGVCGQIDSAPGVAGVGTYSLVGYDLALVGYSAYALIGSIAYDFQSTPVYGLASFTTVLSGTATCTTSTASVYGGYFAPGPVTLGGSIYVTVAPQPDTTVGPYLLAGPYYNGPVVLTTSNANPISAAAVQFSGPDLDGDGNPDTYNGWITFTYNADGSVTCTGSGYQECSIENAIATSGDMANGCMTVGAPTNENPACMGEPPVCNITTFVDVVCDDAGTPDDPSDDMTTVTITVNNDDPANFPTFSDDMGNSNVAYGTPLVYNVVGDGGLTVNFTDDTDGACTASVTEATGCATVENIPTVGEWGLIMLGLLMSITAIVGIRQRREEEVTA